eukprot:gene1303-2515_t
MAFLVPSFPSSIDVFDAPTNAKSLRYLNNLDPLTRDRIEDLGRQLSTVTRAIDLFRESKSNDASLRSYSKPSFQGQDMSYIIDTNSQQRATCPQCFKELELNRLKRHMEKLCLETVTLCPEKGCGVELPRRDLKKHLAIDCVIAKKRRALAASSAIRKEKEEREEKAAKERTALMFKPKALLPFAQPVAELGTGIVDDTEEKINDVPVFTVPDHT